MIPKLEIYLKWFPSPQVLNAVGVQYAALIRYQAADGSFAMFPGEEKLNLD